MWEFFNLVSSADTGCAYSGSEANREFREVSGCTDAALPVDVAANLECDSHLAGKWIVLRDQAASQPELVSFVLQRY